jgi:hypothetical protein
VYRKKNPLLLQRSSLELKGWTQEKCDAGLRFHWCMSIHFRVGGSFFLLLVVSFSCAVFHSSRVKKVIYITSGCGGAPVPSDFLSSSSGI